MNEFDRDDRRAGYRLAAQDLLAFRFDRSRYEDRLNLLLACMAGLGVLSIAVSLIFGGGTPIARMIALPMIVLYVVLTVLLIYDFIRRVADSPLWDRE